MRITNADIAKHHVIKLTLENLGVPDIARHVDWMAVEMLDGLGHPANEKSDVAKIVAIVEAALEKAKAANA